MAEITGLSILIPIYNCNVVNFVSDLSNQTVNCNIDFEILCYDDYSSPDYKEYNIPISSIPGVTYKELSHNYGRAAIRNILATEAQYPYLLFLDCDGKILRNDFIKSYLSFYNYDCVIGGRQYSLNPPINRNYLLHWLAGVNKEVSTAYTRNQAPYHSFMFNNLLIKKTLYLEHQLNEELVGYGHEDTLFGYELQERKVNILHIDNEIMHDTLDSNRAFLDKTQEAVKNLVRIIKLYQRGTDTRLYTIYHSLNSYLITYLIVGIGPILSPLLKRNLLGSSPSLKHLDLLKLIWFCNYMKG